MWEPCTAVAGARGQLFAFAEGRPKLTLEDDGGVRSDEHGNGTSTTNGTSSTLSVDGNVTSHDKSVASIPRGALDPVDGVEECGRSTVAGILGVDALNVGVVAKEVHEDSLDRLGLVDQGLGADVDTADGRGRDLVLVEEGLGDC